ncbi:MAG: hypothetical protein JW934_22795 [Anaerolineae bacterium]|nr:hypothetical protein [Anaerolineae bacterium]
MNAGHAADLDLLRRFEPAIRYTRGEKFFPIEVDGYVRESSLWTQHPGQEAVCLVPEGELTLDKLAEPRAEGDSAVYFLKFIEPMNIIDLAAYQLEKLRAQLADVRALEERFRAGRGRLARVGYIPRLVDALFSLTLLARGRVSGDTAVASAIAYEKMIGQWERYIYYGRVLREGHWTTLQYWFFYPFNCWRSGFFGVNDHEADWEMVCVYLYQASSGEMTPEWVAYAAHDFSGDDLRRRWDDPNLCKVDMPGETGEQHPVIYAGAGSHASYYLPGEYLAEVEIPLLARMRKTSDQVKRLAARLVGQRPSYSDEDELSIFRVPFVDYARGDGLSIGPGQEKAWSEARLLDPLPGWVQHYRGLWGVFVHDPISGENAPAGPMYNRDGSVRRAWYDPVGWAGLDKVPPPQIELETLRARRAQVQARYAHTYDEIEQKSRQLLHLGIEAEALGGQSHLKRLHADTRTDVYALSEEVAELRARAAADQVRLEALDRQAARIEAGERPPPHAHLRHPHYPTSDEEMQIGRLAEGWAAISVGLMLVSFVVLALFARHYLAIGLGAMLMTMLAVEALFRRQLRRFITRVGVILAVVSALIILYEHFWTIMILAVLLAGGYLIVENLRELFE